MKTLLQFLVLIMMGGNLVAQTEYEWDAYGLGFSVTSDFQVHANNESEFTAVSSDGVIGISMLPWADETVTLEHLADAAFETAVEMAAIDEAAVDGDAVEMGDLQGYFVVAATENYHSYEFLLLAFLLDNRSDTNVIVAIGFMDGNQDEAIDLLTSIYPYDP